MTALSKLVNEQNTYLNTHGGPIPRSSFIKSWHDLDNEFWLEVFGDAYRIHNSTKYNIPFYLEKKIELLVTHIDQYGNRHSNVLNPTVEDIKKLPKYITHFSRDKTVKSVFWAAMMELREYYNRVHSIPLSNKPEDKGLLNSTRDIFGELFDVR